MEQRKIFVVVVVGLVVSALACSTGGIGLGGGVQGSGNVVEEEFEATNFTGVSLETIGNLYVEMGSEESLTVEADDNLIEYFEVEVDEGLLTIAGRPGANLQPAGPVNFYLTAEDLDTVRLAGSGDIELPDLTADEFAVMLEGSGDVEMGGLQATRLEVNLSGSGDLDVASGWVDEQVIEIGGSGKYDARDLQSGTTEVSISGSGSATVWAVNSLAVSISGSGSVRYAGSPNLDKLTVSGSGSVEQIN